MALTTEFLNAVAKAGDRSSIPLTIPWPMPGNLGGLLSFSTFAEWQEFVLDFAARRAVPDIVAIKFERSQKLHLLAWIDYELVMTAELVAMTALDTFRTQARLRHGGTQRVEPVEATEKGDELRSLLFEDHSHRLLGTLRMGMRLGMFECRLTVSLPTAPPNSAASARRTWRVLVPER